MIKNYKLYKDNIEQVLENNDLSGLYNSSILVSGANGMIGSCIIDMLNELNETKNANITIYGLTRSDPLSRFREYKNFINIKQDITDKYDFDYKFDYIINAASNSHPKSIMANPTDTFKTNVIGTMNLLEYSKRVGLKRFLFISSGEVYGEPKEGILEFKEDYVGSVNPTNVRSCYPISKISAENLAMSYSKEDEIDVVIVRPCHTYGPTQTDSDSRASSSFIRDVIDNNDIVMKSKGTQIRSYLYVVDCACGVLKALADGKNGNVYNVANNNSIVSIADFAANVAMNANKKIIYDLPSNEETNSFNPVTRSVLSGEKLESIGWTPCFDIKRGITNTINIMM